MPSPDPHSAPRDPGVTGRRHGSASSEPPSLFSSRAYRRLLRVLLASLGVSGFLMVLGYSLASSQHDFLGFGMRDSQSINTYISLSGTMFLHLFVSAVAAFTARPALVSGYIVALAVAAVVTVLAVRKLTHIRPSRRGRRRRHALAQGHRQHQLRLAETVSPHSTARSRRTRSSPIPAYGDRTSGTNQLVSLTS